MQRTQIREILKEIFESETDSTLGELQDGMVLTQDFKLDSVDYIFLSARRRFNLGPFLVGGVSRVD
jgi:acyl carrier protein